jgi:penicillin-binding protein 1B
VVRRGTAGRLGRSFSPTLQLAGKTGTTDNYRDSWFAGYSGNLLTVIWVGRDDNKPIGLTGSSGAMRVWQSIMSKLELKPAEFEKPAEIDLVEIDPVSGLLARAGCPERVSLPVLHTNRIKRYAPCGNFLGKIQSWFDIQLGDPKSALPEVREPLLEKNQESTDSGQ